MHKLPPLGPNLRVLTMDGGPSPLLNVRLLREIERRIPGFLTRVDMFAGTSDGALTTLFLAAGLARGEPSTKILDDAVEFSNGIISTLAATWSSWFRLVLGYAAMNKAAPLRALCSAYGDLTMNALNRRAMVVTFDSFNWKPRYFRNFEPFCSQRPEELAAGVSLVSAALASSAFPMYLPMHFGPGARHFIDGGLVANNPSMCALVSAGCMLRNERQSSTADNTVRGRLGDILMLSMGATEDEQERRATVRPPSTEGEDRLPPKPRLWPQETDNNPELLRESHRRMRLSHWPQRDIDWGWFQWLLMRPLFLVNTMLQAPTLAIAHQCSELLGDHHVRYAPAMGEFAAAMGVTALPTKLAISKLNQRAYEITCGSGPEHENFEELLAWIENHWMKHPPCDGA